MATIYTLTGDLLTIQRMIEDGIEGLDDTLESIELAVADKLEGYAMVIKNIESDITGIKAEEKRLADRRKAMENNVTKMREVMADALQTVDGKRVKTGKFTFSFRKSTVVQITDETNIPRHFTQVKVEVMKSEVKKALANGEIIEGASLVENQSLQIK